MISDILPGKSFPLGATVYPNGVNFCIYSKSCTALELLLFDHADAPQPSRVIKLDPKRYKTFHYWHVFVSGIGAGQIYAYRAYGDFAPERGHRFDGSKVLLDPYAYAVVGWKNYSREAAIPFGKDNCAQALRAVVVDPITYDWEGDAPLLKPYSTTVIYEMNVNGFTRNPNSGVTPSKRGTFAGLIEKIPYLKDLGVTAVELLPIHQFDEQDVKPGLTNYWGYSTIAFFAPHMGYSSHQDPLGAVNEFRDMVKALHKAGIEVILDVVFNHTAEGNQDGPTLSFRGIGNKAYYILDQQDPSLYSNYSGCGNTLKAYHQVVGLMIIDCLRYWVAEMHVDGFRFDLASVLTRSQTGHPLEDPSILWAIESDPVLAGTKIIAEAWDAAGLYQVGSFIGDRFAEWNGPFRDDIRRFIKSDCGTIGSLAARLMGSPDIYPQPDREPSRSINFITCHDGFTMNDLVSYNLKHNEANQENNQDGANANFSWNCGEEGVTKNPEIEALRLRQIKNYYTILLVSQGTPMILMGDEVRRSQNGNNNAYCQNNELSWFDWSSLAGETDLLRFVKGMIRFTQSLEIFRQERILAVTYGSQDPHIVWHGVKLGQPDWGSHSHSLAFTLRHPDSGELLHILLNAYWEPLTFELPPLSAGEHWYRIVDTALPSPNDFSDLDRAPLVKEKEYKAQPRSSVVLMAAYINSPVNS
ncbi:glycogen debranching protein GlgX [Tumidithrix elongata RA019]|uniref:Glycogen debranching protein GlgX n=1 Tax=Tumidithrix elongata BACA0141 TaxID=2716417 RepID=A0AAW9Q9A9_9CYAN|nr:glycogen debranching protein GlgX [Tumidithrix elongata RA019]